MEQNQSQNLSPLSEPQPINQKQFKSFWPIVIIATLSAVIGGLIVWAAFNAGLDEELNSLLPGADRRVARVEPMTSKASESTADWQTYRNEEYGFEITLTDAWKGYKVFSSQGSQGVGVPTSIRFGIPTSDKSKCIVNVTDEVCGYVAPLTITVVAKDRSNVSTVDGKLGENETDAYYYSVYTHFNELPTDLSKINFEIPKVVSTFKFTKTSSETSGWQIYTNEKYGFEFKYPKTWTAPMVGSNVLELGCPKQNFEGDIVCPLTMLLDGEMYFTGDLIRKFKVDSYNTELYEGLGNCKDTFAIIMGKPYITFSDHCSYYKENGVFDKILNSITFAK